MQRRRSEVKPHEPRRTLPTGVQFLPILRISLGKARHGIASARTGLRAFIVEGGELRFREDALDREGEIEGCYSAVLTALFQVTDAVLVGFNCVEQTSRAQRDVLHQGR